MTSTRSTMLAGTLALAALCACEGPAPLGAWENLAPVPGTTTGGEPQPHRMNPFELFVTPDGARAFVTLRGSELEPEDEVVVVDVRRRRVARRLHIGARPGVIRLHPSGKVALATAAFSPYAAVIGVDSETVTGRVELGRYVEDVMFSADGATMWVTNRASDDVQRWSVTADGERLFATREASAPAGTNPGAMELSPDGRKLYVADAGGLSVRVYDATTLTQRTSLFLNAPIFDLARMGEWIVVSTLNDTNGLPCESDADYPGQQGDGIFPRITDKTCARGFADLQNEIVFIDPVADLVAVRYTSDSAQASEADREGDFTPEEMQVVGSLPQRIHVVSPERAFVTMGASFEVVEMRVGSATPPAVPSLKMTVVSDTGFVPRGLGADAAATTLVVANRLGESVSIIDVATGERHDVVIGNAEPPFPATRAETGELLFFTSKFATDGDMSCSHCHPDGENDGKAWNVDVVRSYGRRSVMIMRNLHDTKPLLIEGVFEETDFNLEMEGISFRPDFHDSSYTLQVERRDQFYREVTLALIGRAIGFQEMVLDVAAFLVVEPRLLPSPFAKDTAQVERGRALFERPDVACVACHPPPTFASTQTFRGVTSLGRFDLPRRDLDPDISVKYIENAVDGFFNANSLRGLWDRRGSLFHDGRARSIRETILTPGHACLLEGERAFNEAGGQVDTNGGISHLTCEQIDDLVAYLRTID